MWMSMTTAWFRWCSSAPRWARTPSLFGPRITRKSQTHLAWLLSAKGASKCIYCAWRGFKSTAWTSQMIVLFPLPLQIPSYLQQSFPGGSGHLLLCGHQHRRCFLQLHTHWGGWVSPLLVLAVHTHPCYPVWTAASCRSKYTELYLLLTQIIHCCSPFTCFILDLILFSSFF